MTGAGEPVLLGGYAAKWCPVRIHNDNSPLVPTLDEVPSEERHADAEAGIAFEAEMFGVLRDLHPAAVLVDSALRRDEAVAVTMAAAEAGAPLILGGWLPDDADGGRKGKPDILIIAMNPVSPMDVQVAQAVSASGENVGLGPVHHPIRGTPRWPHPCCRA